MAAPVDPATRKRVLRVVFVSLLLDLVRTVPASRSSRLDLVFPFSSVPKPVFVIPFPNALNTGQLYLHITAVPKTIGILQKLRGADILLLLEQITDGAFAYPAVPQCIQGVICEAH